MALEIYRTTVPYIEAQKKDRGVLYSWAFLADIAMSSGFSRDFYARLLQQYQIFVFPRAYFGSEEAGEKIKQTIAMLKDYGKKVVYEVDDDLSNRYRHVIDGNAIDFMRQCSAVTVSTPILAEDVKALTGLPTYVLPNMLAPELWRRITQRPPELKNKVVIGLTGSPTHKTDWLVLEEPLRTIAERDDVLIIIAGYHPEYLKGLPNTTYVSPLVYDQYADLVKLFDIVLAPVDPDDKFNLGKSPIKVIEGMGAARVVDERFVGGAACIATDNPVYRLASEVMHVEHTPEAWEKAITTLLNDKKLRHTMQARGFNWAWKHHNIQTHWHLWRDAYRDIWRR